MSDFLTKTVLEQTALYADEANFLEESKNNSIDSASDSKDDAAVNKNTDANVINLEKDE